jgi:hypothetical protein
MITRLDRMQLTTVDRRASAERWRRLVGAEVVREDRIRALAAERTVLRAGRSEIELLQPDGLGPAAQHVARSRTSLFAAGLAVDDLAAVRAHLDARAVHHVAEGDQLFLTGDWLGIPGLRVVLSPDRDCEPAGLLQHVYEATHLMRGHERAVDRLVKVFDLDPARFVPISSADYGYRGVLTLFQPDRLDRIETVTPIDPDRTMGRFLARQGPCLYMCYAESVDPAAIRERLREHAPQDWSGPEGGRTVDNLFIHPRALDGAMLGVSRESVAWNWSGHPERVRPARA